MRGARDGAAGAGEAAALAAELATEQATPVVAGAHAVAEALRRRHPGTLAAVFYGSCLRRGTTEGVLDFYLLVEDLRAAHGSRWLGWLGRLLPPNVVVHEVEADGETLRAKVAVMTLRDLVRGVSPRRLDGRVWARFCQPVAVVFARDEAVRAAVAQASAQAVVTAVERLLPLAADAEDAAAGGEITLRLRPARFWRSAFRETYRAELRSESGGAVDALVAAHPERYARVLRRAVAVLAARGVVREVHETEEAIAVRAGAAWCRRGRRAWRRRRPLAKALAVAGLLKTALTFDDWVPYVVWKLERHSGERIVLSARQRRHPLVFGWPVILRLLRRGVLR